MEDVLVQVNELVFPADFYILEIEDDRYLHPIHILLGRPSQKQHGLKLMFMMAHCLWNLMVR